MRGGWFHDTVSALAYTLAAPHAADGPPELAAPFNDLTQFVLRMHGDMADYLRMPVLAATLGFDSTALPLAGRPFHSLPADLRRKIVDAWKKSPVGGCRDLMRFYESLVTLALFSRMDEPWTQYPDSPPPTPLVPAPGAKLSCEVAVIGSGPGGAITACLLAEAGRDVLLLEEGPYHGLGSCRPFSLTEMEQKYRNGGVTMAVGKTKIAYVEGRCVGGGSEINSGLYHRTPPDILEEWRRQFEVEGMTADEMLPHFEACERDVSVSRRPAPHPAAALKLHEGALRMGWHSLDVPTWVRYGSGLPAEGRRQTMTETFVPRFLRAGGRLLPLTRVGRLARAGSDWAVEAYHRDAGPLGIEAKTVFVCAGAVQTPALLRRSGMTHNIGDSLRMHPTVKVVARFSEPVTSAGMGVPVHQVKEFAPRFSMGCSISSPAFLALGMIDHPDYIGEVRHGWQYMANYYAMICSEGSGTVRPLPGFRDPLVKYRLTAQDHRTLGEALRKLAEILFANDALALYPSIARGPRLLSKDDLSRLPDSLPPGLTNLMTIHLFSSCPMGENKRRSAVGSFGEVHGRKNLFVSDASLLCGAPGVNPQGTVMALARRNALHYLGKL
jgi:choline dehydrogenase-like flavoprotein